MTAFVLDCSVAMAWCFEDETVPYTEGILQSLQQTPAIVPGIWPLEVANVLLVAERKDRINRVQAAQFLQALKELPIEHDPQPPHDIWAEVYDLARAHDLSSYDAAYLHLAVRHAMPLATQDKALGKVAEAIGVALYQPDLSGVT